MLDLGEETFRRPPAVSNRDVLRTFGQLLHLARFMTHHRFKKYDEGLLELEYLDFLPTHVSQVQRSVAEFASLDEKVRRVVGDVLLAAMTILYEKYRHSDRASQGDLRSRAEAYVSYASKIKYKLPAETSTRLLHMLVSMGGSF